MRILYVFCLLAFFTSNLHADNKMSEKEKHRILNILDKQVAAWNEGNLDEFMQTYWNSEKLSFVGSRGPIYGWQATLESYKKGYPNKAAMGNLKLSILEMSKIDRKTVYLIGKFELFRDIGNQRGHFTIVIQKIKGDWLIVSDHSSSE